MGGISAQKGTQARRKQREQSSTCCNQIRRLSEPAGISVGFVEHGWYMQRGGRIRLTNVLMYKLPSWPGC